MEATLPCTFFRWVDFMPAPSLLLEEKMPNYVRRMRCCLTSRAMAISFLRRSTGAAPKPSPRGEGASSARRMPCCLTSRAMAISFLHRSTGTAPQAFSPRRRCRTLFAGCGGSVPSPSSAFRRLPHFQSSMLLHNLSSVFSLGRKASQRARRGSRVPHQRPPRRARPQAHTKPHPAAAPHRPHSPQRQVFHRVFHIFAGFPQRLSFPLAFLERDSVRSSEPWVLPAA